MHTGRLSILRRWAVVDDDPAITLVVGLMLREIGIATVEEYASAEQVLNRIEQGVPPFDLVVTDRDMPGIDGISLASRLRACWPSVSIVLATANTDDITAELLHASGIDVVLAKPFSLSELEAVVLKFSRPEQGQDTCLAA